MSESMRPSKHVAEETRSAMCGRLRVGKAAFQIERTKGLCGSPHHDSNYRGRTGCRHSQLRRDLRPPTSLSHGENRGSSPPAASFLPPVSFAPTGRAVTVVRLIECAN